MHSGTCGHPSLSYEPHPEGDHVYRNGCVLRRFRYFADAKKKVDEFNKHPERHMKFWNDQSGVASKDTKCLGVDVPYDAWEKPEVTYRVGQWFKERNNSKCVLARVGHSHRVSLICHEKNGDCSAWTWDEGVMVADIGSITRNEFRKICRCTAIENFTPIDKPF